MGIMTGMFQEGNFLLLIMTLRAIIEEGRSHGRGFPQSI